ncbi:hypothetical protein [Hyphomonas sp.]|uniref:RipA family octameric membrane protein n=1 Tax=Hyphomonas sp. TaxID=87 RepID=UPI0032428CD9
MEPKLGGSGDMETLQDLDPDESIYLEYYKVWIGTITASASRRQTASAFYIAVIAALTGAFSFNDGKQSGFLLLAIWLIAALWFFTIRYFRGVAKAKFDVIEVLEQKLRIPMFRIEWELFKSKYRGHLGSIEVSDLEQLLPLIAWAVSSAALIVLVLNYYGVS